MVSRSLKTGYWSLKLLTYNIQTAISIRAYRDYITQSWRYLFPNSGGQDNLKGIGQLLAGYDIVALQEVDVGSVRSGFVNQVEFLADAGNFHHKDQQITRHFGNLVQQGNALLSRIRTPDQVEHHRLPGLIPGRGAISYRWGDPAAEHLMLVIMHLALSPRARRQQLLYIDELVAHSEHVILMGDMNCSVEEFSPHFNDFHFSCVELDSYPSWDPSRALDHILVSSSLKIESAEVVSCAFSDHLPVAVQVGLPHRLAEQLALGTVVTGL